jgi:hypothetical protein
MTKRDRLFDIATMLGWPLCEEWDAAEDGIMIGTGAGDLRSWNPYKNDAEAFQLAVALLIEINFASSRRLVIAHAKGMSYSSHVNVGRKLDLTAATRMAIVQAATARVWAQKALDNPENIA